MPAISITFAPLRDLGLNRLENFSGVLSIEMAGIKAEQGTANSRSGAPETIRTSDLCLRRATLYPAELRARVGPQ